MTVIAEARSYNELIAALRQRCASLNVPMERVDDVAGLPSRYTSKLLGPVPIKSIGRVSLGPLLGALGLALALIEDTEAMSRVASRLVPRANASGRMLPGPRRRKSALLGNSAWSRVMNARRTLILTQQRRKQIARKAARARWGT